MRTYCAKADMSFNSAINRLEIIKQMVSTSRFTATASMPGQSKRRPRFNSVCQFLFEIKFPTYQISEYLAFQDCARMFLSKMIRVYAVILLLFVALEGQCQDPTVKMDDILTLKLAIELSDMNNLEIKNAELQVEKAEDRVAATRTERLPKLEVKSHGSHNLTSQEYTFNQGEFGTFPGTGPIPTTDTTIESQSGLTGAFGASVRLPLSDQYRIALNIDQTEIAQGIAKEQLRSHQQNITKKVKQQYFSILKTQSALDAKQISIAYYASLKQLVDRYVEERSALEYEAMEVNSRLAKAKHEAFSQGNTLKTQKEQMNLLLARPLDTPFRVSPLPDSDMLNLKPTQVVDKALNQRPDIHEARLKVKHENISHEIKKLEYVPTVDFRVSYLKLYGVDFIPDTDATVGIHAKWEFYDWGRKQDELAQKAKAIVQANNELKQAQQHAIVDVYSRLRKLEEARNNINVTQLGWNAAAEKLRVFTSRYKEKAVLLQDVLRAESELSKAINDYNQSVLSMWNARADLEKAIGDS